MGIGLPVTDPAPRLHDRRTSGDRPLPREPAPTVVVAVALAALLAGAAQVGVETAAGALVGPDVPVDGLVADLELVLAPEAAGDLFGTPVLPELGKDLGPLGGREALVAAGVRAPAPGVPISELGAVAAIVPGGVRRTSRPMVLRWRPNTRAMAAAV
jgi:hypothetical protein